MMVFITCPFLPSHSEIQFNSEFGLYVDKHGDPCRTIGTVEWEGTAERVAFHPPYILLFDSRFIEIRHVETGRLVQIIPGSDVRCIWDGRRVSTSAISPEHGHDSQEAQVHFVMNATDSTNGPGHLKNRNIVQHVCELIPTVQLFTSDTNSTTGTPQDGAATLSSNPSYLAAPHAATSPSVYASSVSSGLVSPASGYTPSLHGYAPPPVGYVTSPVGYAPSANIYPSSSSNVYPSPVAHPNVSPNKYGSHQSHSSVDLTAGRGGGGNTGYFPTAPPSRPPESQHSSRSWRP